MKTCGVSRSPFAPSGLSDHGIVSSCRWSTVAASVDKLQQISTIEFCVSARRRKTLTILLTSSKTPGGEEAGRTDTVTRPAISQI